MALNERTDYLRRLIDRFKCLVTTVHKNEG